MGQLRNLRVRFAVGLLVTSALSGCLGEGERDTPEPTPEGQERRGVQTQLSGLVVRVHADLPSGQHEERLLLDTGSERIALALADGKSAAPGSRVRVQGLLDEDGLGMAARDVTTLEAAPTGTGPVGDRKAAVFLVNFEDNTEQPWTADYVREVMFSGTKSLSNFFHDASEGALSLSGEVFGWYTIPTSGASCANWDQFPVMAKDAARAAGVDLSSFQDTIVVIPRNHDCYWEGLADGTNAYINGVLPDAHIAAHEMGHNYGLNHNVSLRCRDQQGAPVAISSDCQVEGDPFSAMGYMLRLYPGYQKARLGWMSGVETVTSDGTYALNATENAAGGTQLLRIPRPDGTFFWIDLRRSQGAFDDFAPDAPVVNGVSIRLGTDLAVWADSELLDATPATESFEDAALRPGMVFRDDASGIRVTVPSVTRSDTYASAQVRVTFGGDYDAPSAPTGLSATATADSVVLSWEPAADNLGVVHYNVVQLPGPVSATTPTPGFSAVGLAPATSYTFLVSAVDAAGNQGPASWVQATTSAADAQPPSAPTGLTATRNWLTRVVTLRWRAAADDVGVVNYQIYRDGVLVQSASGLSATTTAPRGTSRYTVRALDAAGNLGPASNQVTIFL